MENNRTFIKECVVDSIMEIWSLYGDIDDKKIKEDHHIIKDLFLETDDVITFIINIEKLTGIEVPNNINLFRDKNNKLRTVGEIIDIVLEMLDTKKGNNHGRESKKE